MKAHKEFKNETCICKNCGKEFHPKYSSFGLFCSKKCSGIYRHKESYNDFLNNPEKYQRADYNPNVFYEDILKEQNNKCAICGMDPIWNNTFIKFIVDHIDGHASNNYRENLRCICPNCDSQLDTYKSKNKNSDRIYYHLNHR